MDTTETLGQRIRLSRRDIHLTQQQLADLAKVSRSYISNLEKDRTTNIGRDIAVPLSEALGISVAYLMGVEEDPLHGIPDDEEDDGEKGEKERRHNTAATAAYTLANAELELLITIYQLLSKEKRHILLSMAKVLRDAPHIIGTDPAQPPTADQDRTAP